jgi:sterol 3beta-glucosyltransferase
MAGVSPSCLRYCYHRMAKSTMYVDVSFLYRLGDVINVWRVDDLSLEPLSSSAGPEIIELLKVPYTYCWSPSLIPKPSDWGHNIGML